MSSTSQNDQVHREMETQENPMERGNPINGGEENNRMVERNINDEDRENARELVENEERREQNDFDARQRERALWAARMEVVRHCIALERMDDQMRYDMAEGDDDESLLDDPEMFIGRGSRRNANLPRRTVRMSAAGRSYREVSISSSDDDEERPAERDVARAPRRDVIDWNRVEDPYNNDDDEEFYQSD